MHTVCNPINISYNSKRRNSMKAKNNFKWLIRCVIYTAALNLLSLLVMLLYAENILRDVTSLILLLAIYIISAVLFSPIKGTVEHPLLYNVSILFIHIALNILILLVLGCRYQGWENAMFFWTEVFSMIFLSIVLSVDTIFILVKKQCRLSGKKG